MTRELGHTAYEERLRKMRLFQLKRKRLKEDVIIFFNYVTGVYREDRAKLFSNVQVEGQEATTQAAGRKIAAKYKGKKKKIPGKAVLHQGSETL